MEMYIHQYYGRFQIFSESRHYGSRKQRKYHINRLEPGHIVQGFYVERMHPDGPEIHWVFDNGLIVIVNAWTKALVTELIARPAQVIRYYKACHMRCPQWLCKVCAEHERQGLNEK